MEELTPGAFDRVLPLMTDVRIYRALPLSVVSGGQKGRIFADDAEDPTVAFIANVSGIHCIAGSTGNRSFNQEISKIILDELDHDLGWCMVIPGSTDWAELLEEVLDERIKVGDHPEVYFDFDPSKFAHGDWREHIPPGYAIETIDSRLVDKLAEHYAVFKTWRPASSFDANAFGYCLMYGDEIASIGFAYSSITREGFVELGARTAEKHRRRGLATLVCSAFIDQCLRDNLTPDWHTNSSNSASIALAEGLGYDLAGDFEAYYYSCQ